MTVLHLVFALSMGGADAGLGTAVEGPVSLFIPDSESSEVRAHLPRLWGYLF